MINLDVENKIEPFIYSKLEEVIYDVVEVESKNFLTWNRLDLGFKLIYLELKDKLPKYAQRVYYQDIKSQTLGAFQEFGNNDKDSFEKYIRHFDITYNDIAQNGFDSQKSIIPLSDHGTIVNGAHRVSSSIHLEKRVKAVKLNLPIMTCDYRYFFERNVPEHIIEAAVLKFIEYSENTFIAFLWPSGHQNLNESISKFNKVIYKKDIKLNAKGAFNLLYHLYNHMDWIGTKKNQYVGIQQKLIECFPCFLHFTVIVFQADNVDVVNNIKKEVRAINGIGFSSIHITDNNEETLSISRLLFNENGLHFIKHGDANKFDATEEWLIKYSYFLEKNVISNEDVVLDGSVILSLYGLRENKDIDYISDAIHSISDKNAEISSHDDALIYHHKSKEELIFNPKNYFFYKGFKVLSFRQLYHMKKNRGEVKDINDCKIMDSYISDNKIALELSKLRQYYYYSKIKAKIKSKKTIFKILKKVKLYDSTKLIFNYIKPYL